MCLEEKPPGDFNWRRRALNQRDNLCRRCRAAYKRAHYAAHQKRYVANAAARTRRVTVTRTRFIIDYLGRHPCVDCGEADPLVLEFDHLGDKKFNISEAIRGYRSMDAFLVELQKCEVVCANCHRRRTAVRGGFARALLMGLRTGEPRSDGAGDRN